MKIAVVGGGSTYTPELVDGFARLAPTLSELVLIDPARDRLDVVGPFCQRILAHYGHPANLRWTADLDAGLADAAAVIIQLRIGGQAARISDETFPMECGCLGQETTGAGGLAKALLAATTEDYADAAVRLIGDGEERARLGENARRAAPGALAAVGEGKTLGDALAERLSV